MNQLVDCLLMVVTRNMYILGVWSGWSNEVKNALNVVAIALRIFAHLLQYEFDGSASPSAAVAANGGAMGAAGLPAAHSVALPSGAAANVASRPLTSFGHLVPSFAPNLSSTEGSDAPPDAFSRRLLLGVLLEHAKLCTLLDCAMDFQVFLALRIGSIDRTVESVHVAATGTGNAGAAAAGEAAAAADAAAAAGAAAAAEPSDSLVINVYNELADHFTVVCTLLSYLARSGDVVALLIENEQLKNGRLWQSVSLLLQLSPPPVVMFCIMRLLYSLFASDDPEFVDELWVRDEGRHRAPLKRIANTVISIVRGALVRKIVTPPIVQEALRVIELLADDSNFKRHVTKNGCSMIFELLSFQHADVLAAIVPNSTVPKQKLSIANLLRILAGLHCFNAETQEEGDRNLFVRTSVMLYRGNAQTLDRANIIENLKVVPNVFRADPDRGAFMTTEELDLIMDFAVIFIACVGAGRYHVVDGIICVVPSEELPLPPALRMVGAPPQEDDDDDEEQQQQQQQQQEQQRKKQSKKQRKLQEQQEQEQQQQQQDEHEQHQPQQQAQQPPQQRQISSADVSACLAWLKKMDTIDPPWDEFRASHSGAQWRAAVHKALDQFLNEELDVDDERSLAELVKLYAGLWPEVSREWRVRRLASPYAARYVFTKISQLRSVLWTSYEDNTLVAILVETKRQGTVAVNKLNWQHIAQRLHAFTDGHLRTPLSVRERAIELGMWVERSRGGTGEIVVDRVEAAQRTDMSAARRAANSAAADTLAEAMATNDDDDDDEDEDRDDKVVNDNVADVDNGGHEGDDNDNDDNNNNDDNNDNNNIATNNSTDNDNTTTDNNNDKDEAVAGDDKDDDDDEEMAEDDEAAAAAAAVEEEKNQIKVDEKQEEEEEEKEEEEVAGETEVVAPVTETEREPETMPIDTNAGEVVESEAMKEDN
jgi:hypothetical protein